MRILNITWFLLNYLSNTIYMSYKEKLSLLNAENEFIIEIFFNEIRTIKANFTLFFFNLNYLPNRVTIFRNVVKENLLY